MSDDVFDVYSSTTTIYKCVICRGKLCFGLEIQDGDDDAYDTEDKIVTELLKDRGWNKETHEWNHYVGDFLYSLTKQSHPEYFI